MIARQRQTYGEEVANVLTHGAGMFLGLTAIVVLMMAAIRSGNPWAVGSFAVYAVCMTLSYVTSTFYHASTHARQKRLLRRFDHSAIYLHIAGTYTPFTLVALRQEGYWGWSLFAICMDCGSGRCLVEFPEDEEERPSENGLLSGNGLGSHNCLQALTACLS